METLLSISGRIVCTQCIDAALLLHMSHVAWYVCVCVCCVLVTRVCCVKMAERSRCRLGADWCGSKKSCIRWRSRSDKSIHSRKGWQDDYAAFRQIIIHTCRLFVCTVCTFTDFSAEDKASGVKFCTAVHRRLRQGITNCCELCSPISPKSDKSASARATPTRM